MGWIIFMILSVLAALFVRHRVRKSRQRRMNQEYRLFQYRDAEIDKFKKLSDRKL